MRYETVKRELENLLSLIHAAQATLEDARKRMAEPIENERQRLDAELDEKRKRILEIAQNSVSSEAKDIIIKLAEEKSQGFPWLAKAYDDYFRLDDLKIETYLEDKPHPALKAAEDHRQIAKERREAERAAKIATYLLDYCRYLAPWLDEYIGLEAKELDEIVKEIHSSWEKKEEEFDEEVKHHFGPKYENLTTTEKLQRKLDWWWEKPNKTDWQIGREYERYIGYLYENNQWDVYYHGKMGFEDLGRDLICKKGKNTEIIQCKRWAQEKEIHEKHIYYLFVTTVDYFLEHFGNTEQLQLAFVPDLIKNKSVTPKLITTANVSPKAEQVARVLGVGIERTPFKPYPSVKCNVSRRTGEKIYHLPFDQQYDTILIEEERLECYAKTVAEAEALGFRHAFRWKGEDKTN
jgi:ElaB/YqjD/DUF883 family membrane-anchored ribosome-binding protein